MPPTPFAIIAGVGPGTGASIARKFAAAYSVVLLARNPANYEAVVSEINQSGGRAAGITADVADEDSVKKAFSKIEARTGTKANWRRRCSTWEGGLSGNRSWN